MRFFDFSTPGSLDLLSERRLNRNILSLLNKYSKDSLGHFYPRGQPHRSRCMNAFQYDAQQIKEQARLIRRHVITLNAESPAGGHTGADLSETDILATLYFRILNTGPSAPKTRSATSTSRARAMVSAVCIAAWPRPAISPRSGWRPTSTSTPICRATRCARKPRASNSTPAPWATVCRWRWAWRWRRRCPAVRAHLCADRGRRAG